MKTNSGVCLAVGFSVAILAGCSGSSTPSTADLMRDHATAAQAQIELKKKLASQWERGSELLKEGEQRIKDGEKAIRDAERDLEKARDLVERGKSDVSEGKKLMDESERLFKENFPGMDLSGEK
jgi:exonuclease VII small subunit